VTTSIADAAAILAQKKHIVFVTGAGISVASGIAPYRASSDAVWSRFVTDWGTLRKFRNHPAQWWTRFWLEAHGDLARQDAFQPNAAHVALAGFLNAHPSSWLITQNIDGLHRRAGAPAERTVEIHGRADCFICSNENCRQHLNVVDDVDLSEVGDGIAPECQVCGAPMRPLVLLFDELYESHPRFRARDAQRALAAADAVVFVGTSFSVGITDMAVRAALFAGATLVNVNVESAASLGHDGFLDVLGKAEIALPALLTALHSSSIKSSAR
jgi:NAD-dependent deacetylase